MWYNINAGTKGAACLRASAREVPQRKMPMLAGSTLAAWQKAAAELLFPQRICVGCGAVSPGEPLCPSCRGLRQQLRSCPDCATFIRAGETEHYRCASCRHQKPSFAAARAALPYEGVFRDRLLAFKYEQRTGLRRPLAALMREVWQREYAGVTFDAVVPVPLHPDRLRQRGYNQAELLAGLLAKEGGLPCAPDLLRRIKATEPLAGLDRKGRIAEMRGAFAAAGCRGLRILLIDDIFTTGATAETAARALLKEGAAAIYVLTAAAGRDL